MRCKNKVDQWVETSRYGHGKLISMNCGSTGIHGLELRCSECSQETPWYICRHGNDVSEWQCNQCEGENW